MESGITPYAHGKMLSLFCNAPLLALRTIFQMRYFRSIEKVNAQLPDLNGGVVRLLLQMKKQDSPLIFVVLLLLQMMRLPLQNCIYSYK